MKSGFRQALLGTKSRFNWGPAFVLGVLILVAGPILAPFLSALFKGRSVSASAPAAQATVKAESPNLIAVGSVVPQTAADMPLHSPAMAPQFAIEETPVAPPFLKPGVGADFTLSGIVFSEKESYCLVNGKVLKVGESIGGATVAKIDQDQVTLNQSGQSIILTTTA